MRQERAPKKNTNSRDQFLLNLELEKPKPVRTRAEIVASIYEKIKTESPLDAEEQTVSDEDKIEDKRQAQADHPRRQKAGHSY